MRVAIACLMAGMLAAPVAFACDSHVADVEAAGMAVKSAVAERRTVQTSFDEAGVERERLRREIRELGVTPEREAEVERYSAQIRKAEADWSARTPDWEAAEAALVTAITAHEAACGAEARTQSLLDELGLKIAR